MLHLIAPPQPVTSIRAAGKITFAQWWSRWAAAQDWAAGTTASADQVLASIGFADVPIRSVTENHVRRG